MFSKISLSPDNDSIVMADYSAASSHRNYFYHDHKATTTENDNKTTPSSVSSQLDYLLRIRNPILRAQFEDFGIANQTPIFPLICSGLGLVCVIPIMIMVFIIDLSANRKEQVILVGLILFSMMITVLAGIVIYYYHNQVRTVTLNLPLHINQEHQPYLQPDIRISPSADRLVRENSFSSYASAGPMSDAALLHEVEVKKTWLKRWNMTFIISTQCMLIFFFARRALPGLCDPRNHDHDQHHPFFMRTLINAILCGEHHHVDDRLPLDAGFTLMLCPLFMITLFPGIDMSFIWISFAASTSIYALVTAFLATQMPPLISLLLWLVLGIIMVADSQMKNLKSFFFNGKLHDLLKENQILASEYHANEMRYLIANMAHDLKTPLTSFTSGLELIKTILDEGEEKLREHDQSPQCFTQSMQAEGRNCCHQDRDNSVDVLNGVRNCLQSMEDTNAFMLMTINRCIDFAKASKGVQLVPRNETIDLMSVIDMPIKSMKNVQDRVEIVSKVISTSSFSNVELCPYLITDKQWLQENLLCLLSNAVKYSSKRGGRVQLNASLVDITKIDQIMYPEKYCGENFCVTEFEDESAQRANDGQLFIPQTKFNIGDHLDLAPTQVSPAMQSKVPSFKHSPLKIVPVNTDDHDRDIEAGISHIPEPIHSPSLSPHVSRSNGMASPVLRCESEEEIDQFHQNMNCHYHPAMPAASSAKPDYKRASSDLSSNTPSEQLHLLFEVEDNGIGISEAEMMNLFQPFQQTQRLTGGTGLGLFSLARRIDAIRGKYGVRNRRDPEQSGVIFWFTIPYRPDQLTATAMAVAAACGGTTASLSMPVSGPAGKTENIDGTLAATRRHSVLHAPSTRRKSLLRLSASGASYMYESAKTAVMLAATANTAVSTSTIGMTSSQQDQFVALPTPARRLSMTSTVSLASASVGSSKKLPHMNEFHRPLNILLVDDSLAIIKMTSMMLKKLGHTITSAENGEEAVRIIEERWMETGEKFDVVLMDLQMPVMDGLEATRRIRFLENPSTPSPRNARRRPSIGSFLSLAASSIDKNHCNNNANSNGNSDENSTSSRVPSFMIRTAMTMTKPGGNTPVANVRRRRLPHHIIVGISANSDPDTAVQALKAGMDDFVGKPFSVDTFKKTVHALLPPMPVPTSNTFPVHSLS